MQMKSIQILIFTLSMMMTYAGFALQNPSADSILYVKLYSKILNQDRELIIHLPSNYDSVSAHRCGGKIIYWFQRLVIFSHQTNK